MFDTNVLVSRLLATQNSAPAQVIKHVLENGGLHLFSDATFAEFSEVLMRSKFDNYLSRSKRELFLHEMQELSVFIPITHHFSVCRDIKDNKFLDLAVCGDADYIITGDEDLLILHPFQKVNILSPALFLNAKVY